MFHSVLRRIGPKNTTSFTLRLPYIFLNFEWRAKQKYKLWICGAKFWYEVKYWRNGTADRYTISSQDHFDVLKFFFYSSHYSFYWQYRNRIPILLDTSNLNKIFKSQVVSTEDPNINLYYFYVQPYSVTVMKQQEVITH